MFQIFHPKLVIASGHYLRHKLAVRTFSLRPLSRFLFETATYGCALWFRTKLRREGQTQPPAIPRLGNSPLQSNYWLSHCREAPARLNTTDANREILTPTHKCLSKADFAVIVAGLTERRTEASDLRSRLWENFSAAVDARRVNRRGNPTVSTQDGQN
jgi:hypothetical protein